MTKFDDLNITVDGKTYPQPDPRRLPEFPNDKAETIVRIFSRRLNTLRGKENTDLSAMSDTIDDADLKQAAWDAMVYVSNVTGLPLPVTIPPIFRVTAEEMFYVETGERGVDKDPRGTTYGSTAVGGAYIMLLAPFDLTDVYRHSVLVHEMTHYVQARSGQRHMGIDLASQDYFDLVEYEAYKSQIKWLWERGVNPRNLDALGPRNIYRATRSMDLALFHWLDGWDCSPMRLEETAEDKWERELANPVKRLNELLASLLGDARGWQLLRFSDTNALSDLDAILLVQGGSRDSDEYFTAFQHLIDNSLVNMLGECYVSEARAHIARGELEPRRY